VLAILALLIAAAITSWRPRTKGILPVAAAAIGSVFGRLALGLVAAIGLYVIAIGAGAILTASATAPSRTVERSA
jgi:hypothetical protein